MNKMPIESEIDDELDEQEEKSVSTDMALASAIEFMNSRKNIELKSDIPSGCVPHVVALTMEKEFTDSDIMSKFTKEFKVLRVSRDRKSRQEIIELAKTRRDFDMQNTGVFSRAMNWIRGGQGGY